MTFARVPCRSDRGAHTRTVTGGTGNRRWMGCDGDVALPLTYIRYAPTPIHREEAV